MNINHKKQRSVLIDCFDVVTDGNLTHGFEIVAEHNGVTSDFVKRMYLGNDSQFSRFFRMLQAAKEIVENWRV
jgi:hypothetical protein